MAEPNKMLEETANYLLNHCFVLGGVEDRNFSYSVQRCLDCDRCRCSASSKHHDLLIFYFYTMLFQIAYKTCPIRDMTGHCTIFFHNDRIARTDQFGSR